MKLDYVDERGSPDSDRYFVMVVTTVNAARPNQTRQEFGEIFDSVQHLFEEPIQELKASRLAFGDRSRKLFPDQLKHPPVADRWDSTTESACAKWFTTLAPKSLKALGSKS